MKRGYKKLKFGCEMMMKSMQLCISRVKFDGILRIKKVFP